MSRAAGPRSLSSVHQPSKARLRFPHEPSNKYSVCLIVPDSNYNHADSYNYICPGISQLEASNEADRHTVWYSDRDGDNTEGRSEGGESKAKPLREVWCVKPGRARWWRDRRDARGALQSLRFVRLVSCGHEATCEGEAEMNLAAGLLIAAGVVAYFAGASWLANKLDGEDQ